MNSNPIRLSSICFRGLPISKNGWFNEAIAAYRQSIEFQTDNQAAYKSLGDVLRKKGQFQDALQAYQKVLELKPDALTTYRLMGDVLLLLHRDAEALDCYRRAIAA
ncbi:tetratricopeptide repeat protein [Neosynechococcus sphagnicola]|uniref:tetratricopeptide repeat protein n=1 Tax=Neosynechococcus sphagnicola TaxID=1501145 RepID=UPI000907A932|nr:tetratricopeptide repeat protein [Neosynechococcus sphagnicola]